MVRSVGYDDALVRHSVPPDRRRNGDARLQVREARKNVLEVLVFGPVLLVEDRPHHSARRIGHDEPIPFDVALVSDAEGKNQVILHSVEVRRDVLRTIRIQCDCRGSHVSDPDGDVYPEAESPDPVFHRGRRDGRVELRHILAGRLCTDPAQLQREAEGDREGPGRLDTIDLAGIVRVRGVQEKDVRNRKGHSKRESDVLE